MGLDPERWRLRGSLAMRLDRWVRLLLVSLLAAAMAGSGCVDPAPGPPDSPTITTTPHQADLGELEEWEFGMRPFDPLPCSEGTPSGMVPLRWPFSAGVAETARAVADAMDVPLDNVTVEEDGFRAGPLGFSFGEAGTGQRQDLFVQIEGRLWPSTDDEALRLQEALHLTEYRLEHNTGRPYALRPDSDDVSTGAVWFFQMPWQDPVRSQLQIQPAYHPVDPVDATSHRSAAAAYARCAHDATLTDARVLQSVRFDAHVVLYLAQVPSDEPQCGGDMWWIGVDAQTGHAILDEPHPCI